MGNKVKYYMSYTLEQIMLTFVSGAVLQTVLLEMGLSPETTNQFIGIQTGVQVGTILLFSLWADKIRNLIKAYGLISVFYLPLIAFLFFSCYNADKTPWFLILLFATAFFYNVGYGMSGILSLKLPYQIMDMQEYSKVTAITGVVTGCAGLGLSGLLSWLQVSFSFLWLMRIVLAVTFIATLTRIFVVLSMKCTYYKNVRNSRASNFHLLKYKPFSFFILPNLLRGLSGGLLGMAVSIGYYTGHLNSQSATLIAVITSLVTILGCGVYAAFSGRISERTILLVSSIGVFVFMPMITIFRSNTAFLIFYGLACLMVVFINYAVPVAVTKIADYESMGRYSAGRMLLNNAGNMLAGFACVPLFRLFGVQLTMFIFAGMQLFSGICYYIYMRVNNIR